MGLFPFVAKTLSGLEPVLANELHQLGATGIREVRRAVEFEGDKRLLYRAHYELRTALRILVPIHGFSAYNERTYYDAVREIDWSQYLGVSDTLAVDAVTQGAVFRHSQYLALLTKDAIVDQFRDRTGRRPNVNPEAPSLRIHVHVNGTLCDVSLDASGDSLHKRGYRKDTVEAPLNEVLAAGMVLLSGYKGQAPFVDPMCGSGTLAIEAALVARRQSPHFTRTGFGFFKWLDFDEKLWKSVKQTADAAIVQPAFPILASDKEGRARNATAINAMAAGLDAFIDTERIAFDKKIPPSPPGTLITNPPYDERLQLEDTAAFYKEIGDVLKKNWTGWDVWIISSNRDALKNLGLRPSRRITLFNGALECSFQHLELYAGTQKEKEENPA